jgi:DNA invertase Pin-like site-specific DNA recombinase
MSTEHQQYSTENQEEAIRRYARERGIEIVHTYADEGKSGLRLDGREALQSLLADVKGGKAGYSVILVYDVSRWGRFQDADEAAHNEFVCRRSGIDVHYCAEPFENDGSFGSDIQKMLKRKMAAEYSRELSVKVFAGQRRLIEHGFRQGGIPGFGLRRMRIDQAGSHKGELAQGEHKSIHTDRVILVPGPADEVETVRWIYRQFVEEGKSEREIADILNGRQIAPDHGRPWTRGTVHQILINEKYIGNNVWNRISFKLKQQRVRNEPEALVRADGVFEPLVKRGLFDAAAAIIAQRFNRLSDEEMLDGLKRLYQAGGRLSGLLIDETDALPSSSAYQVRFGSLLRAYRLVGYAPERDYSYIEINRSLRRMHADMVLQAIEGIERIGGVAVFDESTDLLTINKEITASLVIARCQTARAGTRRWHIRLDRGLCPDITLVVRMDGSNQTILDYYILPSLGLVESRLRLGEHNSLVLDGFRFDTLDMLFEMSARASLPRAA